MRAPLSWLRDFAPFVGEPAEFAAALDDLGLVVEEMETVGKGLGDIIVARVDEIAPIEGADRIRLVEVDAGDGTVEVVCGAKNFEVGDLVALAPVGAVLPGGVAIKRAKMKGVASNGMLCSGRELGLSDDHEGILRLNDVDGAVVGLHLTEALGIEPDVIFDIAVEANRPDAWCIAGIARDLAARMGVPFAIPAVVPAAADTGGAAVGAPVGTLASVRVDDLELCPRFTARVIDGVHVGPSPQWLARRLTLAGMRPINNVVDASNYVMLELGQPTHPYDLDRLAGNGLVVRRAEPGETLTTLDGVVRTLGRPGRGLGDTGQDCLICDAEGSPVGIGGVMGGASSEIDASSTRVLLEAAYFDPMAIARTSKRLGLRTEASARFERGCDPLGIDRAAARFCQLLALTAGPGMAVADGSIDIEGHVPAPLSITVRPSKVNGLLGSDFTAAQIAELLTPLGIGVDLIADPARADGGGEGVLDVTVPTFRPDIRPAPLGEADISEEVARIYGYARIARRTPSWPQPGRLIPYQKDRRLLRDVLCGLGSSEVWTETFVSELDQVNSGVEPPFVEVTNPLVESERFLRSSMMPGLIRVVRFNTDRRQGSLRLFEVGTVFDLAESPPTDPDGGPPTRTSERLTAVFALQDDDAWAAVAAWHAIAGALGIADWALDDRSLSGTPAQVLHFYRSATIVGPGGASAPGPGSGPGADGDGDEVGAVDAEPGERPTVLGVVGELNPYLVGQFGLLNPDGRPRQLGWLDLDLGVLLDRSRVPRRSEEARPISRYPSSDIDLAFVVSEDVQADRVGRTLRQTGGELLESVELFDVYRGPSVEEGSRSLAFHLRFCAMDHTLTDDEIGAFRAKCIEAVEQRFSAALR